MQLLMYLTLLVIARAAAHDNNIQMARRLLLLLSMHPHLFTLKAAPDVQELEKAMAAETQALALISVCSLSLPLAGARVRHPEKPRAFPLLILTPPLLLPRDIGRVTGLAVILQFLALTLQISQMGTISLGGMKPQTHSSSTRRSTLPKTRLIRERIPLQAPWSATVGRSVE
jgi:hypothetical protein